MSLLSLHNISIAFGGALLLDNVSLDIQKGQRIGFLGRNGAGKSTFMKIIAGKVASNSGEIIAAPGVRIAYLPQDIPVGLTGSVFEIVASGSGALGEKLAELHQLVAGSGDAIRIADLHHELDRDDGWKIQTAVERTLDRIRLDGELRFEALSGGLQRRALLGRALVREPDLLLLDEPTNHLDIESITWLESFVLSEKLTVLFVTHDRRLLRRLATRIIELDRGRLFDWSCDYGTFLVRKQAVLDAEESEWAKFDKKLSQEEIWLRRGIKARRTRNEGRVQALIKMREERRKRRERSGSVSMTISTAKRSGDRVLIAENLSYSYAEAPIIDDLSITIMRGDRIGIIGPNGCGKTTLLNLLLGKLQPKRGTVSFGANCEAVYFDQLRASLLPEKTVWENVLPGGGDTVYVNGSPKHIISYLQDFLFTSDRSKCPVKQLSGGERNRLMLARIFIQPANVLVFDEPTNDLDAETLELLEDILLSFTGTVLVVSHDREFLNNIVTSTIVFEGNGKVKEYVGGYDDWQRMKTQSEQVKIAAPALRRKKQANSAIGQSKRTIKKLSFKEALELDSLPSRIEQLERDLEELNLKMADPARFCKPGFITLSKERIAQIDTILAAAYERWQELSDRPQ
jgi:ABC transport system ATP-binding/permease protein